MFFVNRIKKVRTRDKLKNHSRAASVTGNQHSSDDLNFGCILPSVFNKVSNSFKQNSLSSNTYMLNLNEKLFLSLLIMKTYVQFN